MSKPLQYAQQSLAASGIAIWSSAIAQMMRPDIWRDGLECGGDFASQHTRNLVDGYGVDCHVAYAAIEGIGGRVKVLARSLDQLAKRIEWLTGRKVLELVPDAPRPQQQPGATVLRPTAPTNGDLFAGTTTKEEGRSCSTCDHFSVGHTCVRPKESGIAVPAAGVLRRCPAYRPLYESVDGRTGVQLWPEISAIPAAKQPEEVKRGRV